MRLDAKRVSPVPDPLSQINLNMSGNDSLTEDEILDSMQPPRRLNARSIQQAFKNQILSVYRERGFTKVSVQVSVPRKDFSEGGRWIVDASVVEGSMFRIGQIEILGNTRFPKEQLLGLYPEAGSPADWVRLRKADMQLKTLYKDLGYSDAKIKPRATAHDREGLLDYRVQIEEGPWSQ
jgi:outer membrane protein assembly factor BamA